MNKKETLITLLITIGLTAFAQTKWADKDIIKPRIRVIVDNDFGGDPDGLFHLAQQLLSPTAIHERSGHRDDTLHSSLLTS